MKRFSLDPDPWNEWIYDSSHRDYNSQQAERMRKARATTLANAPKWMLIDAMVSDTQKDQKK